MRFRFLLLQILSCTTYSCNHLVLMLQSWLTTNNNLLQYYFSLQNYFRCTTYCCHQQFSWLHSLLPQFWSWPKKNATKLVHCNYMLWQRLMVWQYMLMPWHQPLPLLSKAMVYSVAFTSIATWPKSSCKAHITTKLLATAYNQTDLVVCSTYCIYFCPIATILRPLQ